MELKDLELIRNEINSIDEEIIELFIRRMEAVRKVAEFKINNNIQVMDETRERFILNKYTKDVKDEELKSEIIDFLQSVLAISRKAQDEIIKTNSRGK